MVAMVGYTILKAYPGYADVRHMLTAARAMQPEVFA